MKELKDHAREYRRLSKQVEALYQRDEKRLAEVSDLSENYNEDDNEEKAGDEDDDGAKMQHALKQTTRVSKVKNLLPKLKPRPWPAKDLQRLSEDELRLQSKWRARDSFA